MNAIFDLISLVAVKVKLWYYFLILANYCAAILWYVINFHRFGKSRVGSVSSELDLRFNYAVYPLTLPTKLTLVYILPYHLWTYSVIKTRQKGFSVILEGLFVKGWLYMELALSLVLTLQCYICGNEVLHDLISAVSTSYSLVTSILACRRDSFIPCTSP